MFLLGAFIVPREIITSHQLPASSATIQEKPPTIKNRIIDATHNKSVLMKIFGTISLAIGYYVTQNPFWVSFSFPQLIDLDQAYPITVTTNNTQTVSSIVRTMSHSTFEPRPIADWIIMDHNNDVHLSSFTLERIIHFQAIIRSEEPLQYFYEKNVTQLILEQMNICLILGYLIKNNKNYIDKKNKRDKFYITFINTFFQYIKNNNINAAKQWFNLVFDANNKNNYYINNIINNIINKKYNNTPDTNLTPI